MANKYQPYTEYKPSNTDWMGEIPDSWETKKIKFICEIKKRIVGELGYDILAITQKGIQIKDVESGEGQVSMDYSKYQLVEPGDFAMNHMDLLTGYVDVSKYRGVTSPDYRVFVLSDKQCCQKYYLYLFQIGYTRKIFYGYGQGSSLFGRWRFQTEPFKNFFMPFPSRNEQEKIAAFLDHEVAKIDELIEKQERSIELLKEKRQAVISHAVTKGLDPDAKLKDSGVEWLGDVPHHWDLNKIKYVASFNDEVLPETTNSNFEFDYIDIGSVTFENGVKKTEKIVFEKAPSRARRIVRYGDIIVSTVRTYLRAIARIENEGKVICSTGFAVIRPRNHYSALYLSFYLASEYFVSKVESLSVGVSYPAINSSELVAIKIAIPDIKEQQRISSFLKTEIEKIDKLLNKSDLQIKIMKERRTSLITAAVTGKFDVRNWKAKASESQHER